MAAAAQELRTDPVSACVDGAPVVILTDFTIVGDVTSIHVMTEDLVVDEVWLQLVNNGTAVETLSLIVSPTDDTVIANVNSATLKLNIAPKASRWILAGQRVRLRSGNSYTIAAYAGDTNGNMRVIGWFNRLTQPDIVV